MVVQGGVEGWYKRVGVLEGDRVAKVSCHWLALQKGSCLGGGWNGEGAINCVTGWCDSAAV